MSLDRDRLQALRGSPRDYDALIESIGDRRIVLIHIDETSALAPLEKWSQHPEEAPETYPTGM